MFTRIFKFMLVGVLIFAAFLPTAKISAVDPIPWDIWVNDFSDAPDFAHNSVCDINEPTNPPSPPVCTLRAALDEANKCPDDPMACELGAIIHVPSGTYNLTLTGAGEDANVTGDLDINSWEGIQIIIEGDSVNPPVINANGLDRVFHVLHNEANSLVEMRNLVIQGGHLELNTAAGQTYANGGGVLNSGNLWLTNVTIQDNQLTCADPAPFTNCYQATGGGLFNTGALLMSNSTIRNNTAYRGGGIFHNNTETQAQVFHSTISGNQAMQSSGGLENYGRISFTNATISGNTAASYGGIYNDESDYLTLMNVTLAGNIATTSAAANLGNYGNLTIMNSIIAYPGGFAGAVNCHNGGSWTMGGGNLYSDSSCLAGPGVISSTDPRLSPLAWLGGPTMTRGLLPGSPAHNVYEGFCLDITGGTVTLDQRGQNRDHQCDLGSFEGVAYSLFAPIIRR